MFKKITKLTLAAITSLFVTTACTDYSSPTDVVKKANYIQNYKNFSQVAHYYTQDFTLQARNGADYNQEKLRAISQRATMFPEDKTAARATVKTLLMDTFDLTPEQLETHYSKSPDAMLTMENLLLEIAQDKVVLSEKKASSFNVLKEATKGETSTVIAEYKEYAFNAEKEIVESVTIEVSFTLKKIENEWKIIKAIERKK